MRRATGLVALSLLAGCASKDAVSPIGPQTIPDVTAYLYQAMPSTTRRHDWPAGPGFQVTDTAKLPDGSFATFWSYPPFGPFVQTNGDGGEVYVTDGKTVRIVATQDGGKPYLQGFYGAGCGGTGWVAFRNDAPSGSWASLIARFSNTQIPSPCSAASRAFTRYRLESVAFPFLENNQPQTITLSAVISEHYDGSTIAESASMERSFFAQGMGRVIWEAWSKSSPSGSGLSERCPSTIYSVPPAEGWQLSDCRVATNLQPGTPPADFGWPPATPVWP